MIAEDDTDKDGGEKVENGKEIEFEKENLTESN